MASDNFTRANENPLTTPWTTVTGFQPMKLVSNAILGTAASTSCGVYYNSSTSLESIVTIGTVSGFDVGCLLNVPGTTDLYVLTFYTGSDAFIFRVDAGGFNLIATVASITLTAGDVVSLARVGGNLVAKRNTTTILTVADNTYTAVKPGCFEYDGASTIVGWSDGAAAAADQPPVQEWDWIDPAIEDLGLYVTAPVGPDAVADRPPADTATELFFFDPVEDADVYLHFVNDDEPPQPDDLEWDWIEPPIEDLSNYVSAPVASAGGAADLAGNAVVVPAATGNLTTQIQVAAAAVALPTASGNLTSQIQLAGTAAAVALAAGDLTIQIQLAGSAIAQALAQGGLTNAIQLIAAAQAQASATGNLLTAVQLAGIAQAVASATGDLTGGTSGLSGAAIANAIATGNLSTQIQLSGSAVAQAIVQAALTSGILLQGSAAAQALAAGDLVTAIRLAGSAIAQASASGSLTAPGSGLGGDAVVFPSATGALTNGIRFAGSAQALVVAQGGLTNAIRLAGSAVLVANATGDLTVQTGLTAAAIVQAAASGVLTTSIRLSGAAIANAVAAGLLASVGTIAPSGGGPRIRRPVFFRPRSDWGPRRAG